MRDLKIAFSLSLFLLLTMVTVAVAEPDGTVQTPPKLSIRADGLFYDQTNKTVIFSGNVKVQAGNLQANASQAEYALESQNCKLSGDVILALPDAEGTAQTLDIQANKRSAHLSGNVQLSTEKMLKPGFRILNCDQLDLTWDLARPCSTHP